MPEKPQKPEKRGSDGRFLPGAAPGPGRPPKTKSSQDLPVEQLKLLAAPKHPQELLAIADALKAQATIADLIEEKHGKEIADLIRLEIAIERTARIALARALER